MKQPAEVLRNYLDSRGFRPLNSVEGTLNRALIHLARESLNHETGLFREELISASAISLMGLRRIADPVRLYRNLANAFERRDLFIVTGAVRGAFIRLQNDAIKRGQEKAVRSVLLGLKNKMIAPLSPRLSPDFLKSLPARGFPSSQVAQAISASPACSLKDLRSLLDFDSFQKGALMGLLERKSVPVSFLESLLTHASGDVRYDAAFLLASRGYSPEKLEGLKDAQVLGGLSYWNTVRYQKRRPPVSDLERISGKRVFRGQQMKELTRMLKKGWNPVRFYVRSVPK
ncbi:MAG: hypothetical protein HY917_01825 [Candidatus Diapherotrites archaeon]|nr:hypothetical protein [Candidatus Diapherotrites archaeon]